MAFKDLSALNDTDCNSVSNLRLGLPAAYTDIDIGKSRKWQAWRGSRLGEAASVILVHVLLTLTLTTEISRYLSDQTACTEAPHLPPKFSTALRHESGWSESLIAGGPNQY